MATTLVGFDATAQAAEAPDLEPETQERSAVAENRIQELIQAGIDEGATLVTGGLGRPAGLEAGYYVRPTLFANVTNDMRIAQEESQGRGTAALVTEKRFRPLMQHIYASELGTISSNLKRKELPSRLRLSMS